MGIDRWAIDGRSSDFPKVRAVLETSWRGLFAARSNVHGVVFLPPHKMPSDSTNEEDMTAEL